MSKTAAETGFSSTYIRKLAKEGKAGRTPGKNRHQKKGKFGTLDYLDLGVIRRITGICISKKHGTSKHTKILIAL